MDVLVAARLSLLCRVGSRFVAIPASEVDETLRLPRLESLPAAPAFVSGLATVRGLPTPVVDAGALLGSPAAAPRGRFVILRVGERRVALGVDAVLGLRTLSGDTLQALPPLVEGTSRDFVEAIGTLDSALLLVLRGALLVPEAVWSALAEGGA